MIRRLALTCGLVVAAVALVAGCSEEPVGSTRAPVVDPGGGDAAGLPAIPQVPGAQGAIADAMFSDCDTAAGARSVDGTVENPTNEHVDYVVVVSWIDAGATVLGRGVAEVDGVRPERSADFSVEADVPDGAVSCTYYVTRSPAA